MSRPVAECRDRPTVHYRCRSGDTPRQALSASDVVPGSWRLAARLAAADPDSGCPCAECVNTPSHECDGFSAKPRSNLPASRPKASSWPHCPEHTLSRHALQRGARIHLSPERDSPLRAISIARWSKSGEIIPKLDRLACDPDARTLETFALHEGHWLLLATLADDALVSLPPSRIPAGRIPCGAELSTLQTYVCSCCGLPVCPPPCPTGGTGALAARGVFCIPASGRRVPKIPKGCERGAKLKIALLACPPARAAAGLAVLCPPPHRPFIRHSVSRDRRRLRLRHRFTVNRDRIRYIGASHATSHAGGVARSTGRSTSVKLVSNQCNGRLY